MLIYSLAAFAVSVLAGTGVGGGGLFVIYLTMICGMAQAKAQAVNLVFFISAALAALPYHLTHRKMNTRLILFCTVFAIAGTLIGVPFFFWNREAIEAAQGLPLKNCIFTTIRE